MLRVGNGFPEWIATWHFSHTTSVFLSNAIILITQSGFSFLPLHWFFRSADL